MPRRLLISNRAEVRPLFEGGVYSRPAFIKLAGRYLRAYAVRQNDLPPCNRFFFCPLYTISSLSFRHFLTRFSSTPNLLAAPLLFLVRVRVYVEPRPQSTNNYYCCGVYMRAAVVLSRKFWSGENFGPGDQNSRKIGPPGPLFPENLGPAVE